MNKPPPNGRVWKQSKADATCSSTSQNPSHWHPSWLSNACTTRKDPESELLAKDNPVTNPITIKPKTASHIAEQFWIPLPYCSPPQCPFPIKTLALSASVSPQKILLQVLTRAHSWALEGAPLPATYSWQYCFLKLDRFYYILNLIIYKILYIKQH